ncbi:site-2 protease family protein [Desulfotruncus alcoholivorax]|uniref:site-2 protease family protein n=1 Tax=Desulfotruncus alcoholivorax TaxID=265477 RepID=UPI0038993416
MVIIAIAWYLGILFLHLSHEFGHAFFRYVFKAPAKEIEVGKGPQIYSGQFGGLKVQVRLFPFGGICKDPFNRNVPQVNSILPALVIFAGGNIVNTVEALILFFIIHFTEITLYNIFIFRFLFAVSVVMLVGNSIPYSSNNDGRKILLAIKGLLTGNVTREWLDSKVSKSMNPKLNCVLFVLSIVIGGVAFCLLFVINVFHIL